MIFERVFFDSSQSRREHDALYRAAVEHFSKVFMLQKYKNTCLEMVKAHKNASFCTAQNEAFESECETDFFTLSAFFTFGI